MSSHYTTVSCAEWDEMQNTIQAADAYQIRNQEEIARLDALTAQRRTEMEQMRQANRRAVDAAQDYLIQSYRNASSKLSAELRSELGAHTEGFEAQLNQMRTAAANISSRTAAASDAIDQLSSDFSKAVSALLDSQPHEESRAKRTLDELDRLLNNLRSLNPSGQNFVALQTLEGKRAAAAGNIDTGNYQAALILTQGSILTASRALTSAILEGERYGSELAKVRSAYSELQSRFDSLSSQDGTLSYNVGEDSCECEYDIDFWSHGLFGELKKQSDSLGREIQDASKGSTDINRLRNLTDTIHALESKLTTCDQEARRDLAGTLALENTVQRLYTGLEERGWSIEESGHQDDDVRKPYAMTCTDGAGNVVSIVGAGGERPEMPSFFYEAFADNEGMADLVKDSVAATLQTEGINIESDVERNDCAGNASPDSFVQRIVQEASQTAARRQASVRQGVEIAR